MISKVIERDIWEAFPELSGKVKFSFCVQLKKQCGKQNYYQRRLVASAQ